MRLNRVRVIPGRGCVCGVVGRRRLQAVNCEHDLRVSVEASGMVRRRG